MSGLSVLTIVRDREPHLLKLIEGLVRSRLQPDELVVVDMSDVPVVVGPAGFPIRIERFDTSGLPLAAARNLAARAAQGDQLVFLDVDCIPMADCLGRLGEELARRDGLLCADVRYLGPGDARGSWTEAELLERGRPHPVRSFPEQGVRRGTNPGLFWSLAFAMSRASFRNLGGFDERYVGYGAEDTDFGFRADEAGLPFLFVGGAIVCHQHHDGHEPPVQHLRDIVRNAATFHARWGRWPMEGWLDAFERMGLVSRTPDTVRLLRDATPIEMQATRIEDPVAGPTKVDTDRSGRRTVSIA